jgi:hypothetical protein
VKKLFISKNQIGEEFEAILKDFASKIPQDQLSILDIVIEKCAANPERINEFKTAGGYEHILYFFSQSTNDETEENPDLYILCFQIIKLLLFLDKSGFTDEVFKVFVDIFWKNTNLEIVMGALIYLKQMIELSNDKVSKMVVATQFEAKMTLKWLWIISQGELDYPNPSDLGQLLKEVGGGQPGQELLYPQSHRYREAQDHRKCAAGAYQQTGREQSEPQVEPVHSAVHTRTGPEASSFSRPSQPTLPIPHGCHKILRQRPC